MEDTGKCLTTVGDVVLALAPWEVTGGDCVVVTATVLGVPFVLALAAMVLTATVCCLGPP